MLYADADADYEATRRATPRHASIEDVGGMLNFIQPLEASCVRVPRSRERAEIEARRRGLKQLFSLTTHSPHWFIEHGFVSANVENLPMARQQLCNYQRNSLVLVKAL